MSIQYKQKFINFLGRENCNINKEYKLIFKENEKKNCIKKVLNDYNKKNEKENFTYILEKIDEIKSEIKDLKGELILIKENQEIIINLLRKK